MRRRRLLTLVTAAGVVAAPALVVAGPAAAHGAPYTVTAGSAPAGTAVAVTLRTTGSAPQFTWKDTTTGLPQTCDAASIKGALTVGSSSGVVGTLTASTLTMSNCLGPAGIRYVWTGYGTWTLNATDSASGSTAMTVRNVRAHAATTAGWTCAIDFAASSGTFTSSGTATTDPGSLALTYNNSSQTASMPATNPGSLGLWNVNPSAAVHNCVSNSILKQGDRISWSATWQLTADNAAYNPIAIN